MTSLQQIAETLRIFAIVYAFCWANYFVLLGMDMALGFEPLED